MRQRYGPDAELGGFCGVDHPETNPCAWRLLRERVLKHDPSISEEQFAEMSDDDLLVLLPAEEREELLAERERWQAEMDALRIGRLVRHEKAA